MTQFRNADRPLDYTPLEAWAPPRPLGYWTRRIEVALTGLIIFATVVWAVCK